MSNVFLSVQSQHNTCNVLLLIQFYSLQRQIDDKCADINKLKQERQQLLGLIRSLESDLEDLKRQIAGHERTNQDKVRSELHYFSLHTNSIQRLFASVF